MTAAELDQYDADWKAENLGAQRGQVVTTQERSSSPRPAKPSPQVWERANGGPCAPLRRSPDEDRDCATSPADDAEAAAERELLRLCFVHAKDAAWATWFHECIWLGHDSKVEALAAYRRCLHQAS